MSKSLSPKLWSTTINEDHTVTFHQQKRTLCILLDSLSSCSAKMVITGHYCGGCIDLPLHGYGGSKSSWCQFSREIANLYDEGYKWVRDEPHKRYIIVVDKYVNTIDVHQTFYLFKGSVTGLNKKIKKIKKEILALVALVDKPYKLGYISSELRDIYVTNNDVKLLCGNGWTNIKPIPKKDIVVITDRNLVYALHVKELNDELCTALVIFM
jgi:hypothetical protein